jgi:hypothetical protein
MARTGLNLTEQLQATGHSIGDDPRQLPTNVKECTKQLREARREVAEIVRTSFARRDGEQLARIEALTASPYKSDKANGHRLRCMRKAEDIKQ